MTSPPRAPALPALLLAALGGLVAGVAAKAADESGPDWAGDLGTHPAAWVLAVALLARLAPSVTAAALRAGTFFTAMTVAYYAWASLVLGFPATPLLTAWLVTAVTAVPVTAACVRWAVARSGPLPGLLLAGVAGVALAGASVLRLYYAWTSDFPWFGVRPVQVVVDLVVAGVVVAVLPLHRSTRLWAAALLVPAAWASYRGVELLYGVLG